MATVRNIASTIGLCLVVAPCVYTAAYFMQVQQVAQLGSSRVEPGLFIREVPGPLPYYSSMTVNFFAPIHALDRRFLRPKTWPQSEFFTNVLSNVRPPI